MTRVFSEHSYGFRPKHSQHQAVRKVQSYIAEGRKIAVDVDLSKFFGRFLLPAKPAFPPSLAVADFFSCKTGIPAFPGGYQVNHDFLMTQLGKKIKDKGLLKLIAKYLRTGIVENGVLLDCREGVPQGGPLSPLLSNIVLDVLDKELERRNHKFARWADDFIILVGSKRAGDRVLASVTRFVECRLKLKVNDQKSQVVPVSKSKFLGFSFRGKSWYGMKMLLPSLSTMFAD